MKFLIRTISCAFILFVLSSCSWFCRETHFTQEDRSNNLLCLRTCQVSDLPRITLISGCVQRISLFMGPYALPIIPNLYWPIDYSSYNKEPANFLLIVEAPPKKIIWDAAKIDLLLNGKSMKLLWSKDFSTKWKDEWRYSYSSGLTCKEVEESKLSVVFDEASGKISENVLFTHTWRMISGATREW